MKPQPLKSQPRVLVVDDHALLRCVAATLFEAAGCQVSGAADGLAALDAVRDESFDLVLMDRRMPGCDGDAAVRLLRAGGTATRDALIVSHSSDPPTGEDATIYDDVIAKPLQFVDVVRLVSRLDRRAALSMSH